MPLRKLPVSTEDRLKGLGYSASMVFILLVNKCISLCVWQEINQRTAVSCPRPHRGTGVQETGRVQCSQRPQCRGSALKPCVTKCYNDSGLNSILLFHDFCRPIVWAQCGWAFFLLKPSGCKPGVHQGCCPSQRATWERSL